MITITAAQLRRLCPKIHPDWRRILTKAWSVRLILLAGLLTGAEWLLHLLGDYGLLTGWMLGAAFMVTAAAFVARLVAQRDMRP